MVDGFLIPKETAVLLAPIATLILGLLIGWLCQKNSFCSIGGIAVGIIGTLLGGCPLRQLVMTSKGNMKSLIFVVGMLLGAVLFTALISQLVIQAFTAIRL